MRFEVIKKIKSLFIRRSEQIRKNPTMSKTLGNLESSLEKGYFNAPLRSVKVKDTKGAFCMRACNGARLFYKFAEEVDAEEKLAVIEIIAECHRDDEGDVINDIRKFNY